MKKLVLSMLCVMSLGFLGCASNPESSDANQVKTSEQFQFKNINFELSQFHNPQIVYHTPEELESVINQNIMARLIEKDLLSNQAGMNELNISISYERRFVGDETPLKSDSLAYPIFAYKIEVIDAGEVIKTIERKNLTYSGGFGMNLRVMSASLRDKKHEIKFAEAIANTIVKQVSQLPIK